MSIVLFIIFLATLSVCHFCNLLKSHSFFSSVICFYQDMDSKQVSPLTSAGFHFLPILLTEISTEKLPMPALGIWTTSRTGTSGEIKQPVLNEQ